MAHSCFINTADTLYGHKDVPFNIALTFMFVNCNSYIIIVLLASMEVLSG